MKSILTKKQDGFHHIVVENSERYPLEWEITDL